MLLRARNVVLEPNAGAQLVPIPQCPRHDLNVRPQPSESARSRFSELRGVALDSRNPAWLSQETHLDPHSAKRSFLTLFSRDVASVLPQREGCGQS